MQRAADLLVRCLENEGVEQIFGVPGEETLSLLDALSSSEIAFITTRHEQGAALMADVYGRLSGRAGVCLATLGPGATNLVTGVADAFLDRAPLVAITAQANLSKIHRESHQYVDILQLFSRITKWNARVESPDVVPEIRRKAFKLSEAEKPGATHVELPENVAEDEAGANQKPLPREPVSAPTPARAGVEQAARLIEEAVRPIICVGYDFVEYDPRSWNPRGDRRIIHVDALPAEISANYLPAVEVLGEIRESLQALAQRIRKTRPPARLGPTHDAILKALESELGAHSENLLNPRLVLWDFREILEPDDLLISDVGAHKLWLSRFFRVAKFKTIVISNGLSPMGIALPNGIAAKLLDPDRRVVTPSGDGGFLMSVHELETAKRERAATVNLVFRDGGLGSIRWKQFAKFKRTVGTDFGNPDFTHLAKAFGLRGFRVEHPKELRSVLEEAMESKDPCVVDIPVDYTRNPVVDLTG